MLDTSQHTTLQAIDELARLDRWVMWRAETRYGKPTKVPYVASRTWRLASSTDSTTWSPYDTAMRCCDGRFSGIGIVLGELGDGRHLCGIDLDSCTNNDGQVAEWAWPFLDLLAHSYVEDSPSHTGAKAFFFVESHDVADSLRLFGVQPGQRGRKVGIDARGAEHGPAVEFYSGGRYFAVTGERWPQCADRIATLDLATLGRLAALLPQTGTAAATDLSSGPRDASRSAVAFGIGHRMKERGASFDEFVAAVRADPRTADWYVEKGERSNQRELHRIWDRACVAWTRDKDVPGEDALWRPVLDILPLKQRQIDEAKLKPRKWVAELLPPEGKVAVMAAPGGTGKTTIALAVGMSVAANEPLLGLNIYAGGGAVAYCLLEDDEEDILKSIVACAKHYKLLPRAFQAMHSLGNRPGRHGQEFVIARRSDYGDFMVTPLVEKLIAKLKFDDIRLLIVDAFRFTHSLAENDNDDMSGVMRLWNEVARRAHCVILLLHHFKKGRDRGVDQARGAASITDHARAALPLSIMLKAEAEQFDLPDHHSRYVRLDDPKLNFQAKPQDAVWFHLAEVELANGDKVPVAERWYPSPSTRAPVPLSDELAALIERGPSEGDYYTKDRKSADRWFGKAVMEHMDVDADKAAKLMAQWLKQGQLVETDYISPRRRGKQQRLCLPAQ